MLRGRKILRGERLPWRTQGSAAFGRVRRKLADGTRVVAALDAGMHGPPGRNSGTPPPGGAGTRDGSEPLHRRGRRVP